MSIVQTINGFNFYFEILDFQGDNKKFYINIHSCDENHKFKNFIVYLNRQWVKSIGMQEVKKELAKVFENPIDVPKTTLEDLWRIDSKIKHYKSIKLEKDNQLYRKSIKDEFKKIENVEVTLIEKFKSLNTDGQAMLMSYLDDLMLLNKYRLGA
ncbi:hypothetical protein [Clostridium fallax]|uniref:Uncharacterized protein n=1 Tax=Clostridium fallax TaxID=1533 RepID=A0A1M4ZBI8_9CLOT|nr:hypothetical protein [Clostridium fallax]SHF15328.1 hypothetical protein SAMN05443638_14111 [Clostridium fallax]SQB22256.1 Uncharacterised protein [Clostridium fallax]